MAELIYNSRDARCKSPFGAVPAGTEVVFRAGVPGGCSSPPRLRVYAADRWEAPAFEAEMAPDGELSGAPAFSARFTPQAPALLFYDLSLEGVTYRHGGGGRAVADLCAHFQLTVYDGTASFPMDFAGGVMYQIFPDRFYKADGCGSRPFSDRRYHEEWNELPDWRELSPGRVNKDYFGGNLAGITEKLGYLASLSVTCLYLNPIFESHSNHRYDTADYMKIDPLLGDIGDFKALCAEAKKRGISVILDGVFNHTGADSRYFDRFGRYGGHGAWGERAGAYSGWYEFGEQFPAGYRAWWDFPNLPAVNKTNPGWREFVCGEGGVLDYWLDAGASGFRLDVADELPDDFIADIRRAVKRHGNGKLLLGEVWEDASNKIAYGVRRRYLLGDELDSAMGYPIKDALLGWLRDGGAALGETLCAIAENYPAPALALSMNMLSTHDTARALTVLGGEPCAGRDRAWQAAHHELSPGEYRRGQALLKLAFAVCFMLPGIPSIYYGDEAGLCGCLDPFDRCTFPWGREDEELQSAVRALGLLRAREPLLADAALVPIEFSDALCCFERRGQGGSLFMAANRGNAPVPLPPEFSGRQALYGSDENGFLPPLSALIAK